VSCVSERAILSFGATVVTAAELSCSLSRRSSFAKCVSYLVRKQSWWYKLGKNLLYSVLSFRNKIGNINNCPTRFNTKQSIYYSASSLYMYRVSTTPIITRTQNCNYSFRYWSYSFVQLPPSKLTWPRWRKVAAQKKYDQYRRL